MNARSLQHEPTLDPIDAAALSEDGDASGDAAVRGAAAMLVTMVAALAGVAAIVAVVVMLVGRRRKASALNPSTLMELPAKGIDAVRHSVEHLAEMVR